MTAFLPFLVAFARLAIGLVFAYSFCAKVVDPHLFARTIAQFGIVPTKFTFSIALLLIFCELLIVLAAIAGGMLLLAEFILATGLLLLFSLILASALVQRVTASCNCFGPTSRRVSRYDLWRNAGLIVCALGGWGGAAEANRGIGVLSGTEWLLTGFIAAIVVAIWTQLGEIVQFFYQR